MHRLVEDGLGNNARMSGGRVKGWRVRVGPTLSRDEMGRKRRRLSTIDRRISLRRLRGMDKRIYPRGPSTTDRGAYTRRVMWSLMGGPATTQEADIDFFSGADLELARFILQGEGSGSGSVPHASAAGPSGFETMGPPTEMYEVFMCSPSTMDQLAQEFVAGRGSDDAVYRPEPPVYPHVDHSRQVQGFQYYSLQPPAFPQSSPLPQYMLTDL
ncbi:hypothetical protein PIB30_094047 [Stylosanthes scabra]|uniref:Uncharacterized protein n=1 Tax=Stylosanthes scabra TaxID=79078 RepID=A0ABU6TXA6_9FABA|nr:hypothetical protein [Stylosanthes scabra]